MTTQRWSFSFGLMVGALLIACAASEAGGAPDGGAVTPDAGDSGRPNAPPRDGSSASCSEARKQLLEPLASVSTGDVLIFSDTGGVVTVFVDARAGGLTEFSKYPRVYLDIATPTKVAISDEQAATSMDWDLAIERPILFTNSGQGGPGEGGAVKIAKPFDQVTAQDAQGAAFATERFVEADCTPRLDANNSVKTTFDGWYDYDPTNNSHQLTPAAGTWLVRGATGALFKIEFLSWYATPDAGVDKAVGGRFMMKIAAL